MKTQREKKNKHVDKKHGKITKDMINKENKELNRVTNFLLHSLKSKYFPKDFRKKILEEKLIKIRENIKKKNETLLDTKTSNKIGGGPGGDKDIKEITDEAERCYNQLVPPTRNNDNDIVQNELPIVDQTDAETFVHDINNNINNNITIRGNRLTQNTLNQLNLPTTQLSELGVIALQHQNPIIRRRAFDRHARERR